MRSRWPLPLLLCLALATPVLAEDVIEAPAGEWFLITEFRGQEMTSSITITRGADGVLAGTYVDGRGAKQALQELAFKDGTLTFKRQAGGRTIGFEAQIDGTSLKGNHKLGGREIPVVGALGKAAFEAMKTARAKANERGDDLEADYDKHARQVVKRDSFPVLFDPKLKPVAEAEGIRDDEPVIGIAIKGEAKAYPISIMGVHELANDTIGGQPIAASW